MSSIRITAFLSLVMTVAASECALGQVERTEPAGLKTEQLLKLSSVTLSEKSGHKSFLVTTDVNLDDFSYRVLVGWRAPDQSIMLMLDPRDNTPLIFTMADRTIVYDPAKMVFYSSEGSGVKCEIKQKGDRLDFQVAAPSDPQLIDVDLGSILRNATRDVKITGYKEGMEYSYIGSTERGNRIHAVIVPDSGIPLQKLDLFVAEEVRPTLSFTLSEGGAVIDDGFFEFSIDALKELKIPIVPAKDNLMASGVAVGGAVMVRAAMGNPSLREENEFLKQLEVDWDELGRKDAAVSKGLRELFATQIKGSGIQQGGAGQPATAPESKSEGKEKPKPESEGRSQ